MSSSLGQVVVESFFENLRAELDARLRKAGFEPFGPTKADIDRHEAAYLSLSTPKEVPPRAEIKKHEHLTQLSQAYFNVLHRHISPRPRKVLHSRLLEDRVLLDRQVRALQKMEHLVELGEPLGLYQSKQLDKPRFDDLLFNAWGIHHLHFIGRGDNVKTGDELLFVVVQRGRALFVDLGSHEDFGAVRLLNIIDENWPEVLGADLPGVVRSLDKPRTSQEELAMREAGITTVPRLASGRVVMPAPGMTGSGLSADVLFRSDELLDGVAELSRWLRDDHQRASDCVRSITGQVPRKLKFRLCFEGEDAYIVHDGTRAKIPTEVRLPLLPHRSSRLFLGSPWSSRVGSLRSTGSVGRMLNSARATML